MSKNVVVKNSAPAGAVYGAISGIMERLSGSKQVENDVIEDDTMKDHSSKQVENDVIEDDTTKDIRAKRYFEKMRKTRKSITFPTMKRTQNSLVTDARYDGSEDEIVDNEHESQKSREGDI